MSCGCFTGLLLSVIIYAVDGEENMPLSLLLKQKLFWLLLLMMFCAGSCEQAVSQWASTFAEKGLHVSKTIGDLAGPMMFAILMGTSRAVYGKYGDKIDLMKFMTASGILHDNLRSGILIAVAFPVLLLILLSSLHNCS